MDQNLRNQYLKAMGFTPLVLREPTGSADAESGEQPRSVAPQPASANAPIGVPAASSGPPRQGAVASPELAGDTVDVQDGSSVLKTLQEPARPAATVLVAWDGDDLELSDAHPGGELLGNILTALNQPIQDFRILCYPVGARPDAQPASVPLFCFADEPPWSGDPRPVMAPSLTKMLEQGTPAKRQAWQILKPWVGRLAT